MASESWVIINNHFYVSFNTFEGDSKWIPFQDATQEIPHFKKPNPHYYVHRFYLLV